jgi:hypothetical protein
MSAAAWPGWDERPTAALALHNAVLAAVPLVAPTLPVPATLSASTVLAPVPAATATPAYCHSDADDGDTEEGTGEEVAAGEVASMFAAADVEYETDEELEQKREAYAASLATAAAAAASTPPARGTLLAAQLQSLVDGHTHLALPPAYWRAFDTTGTLTLTADGVCGAAPALKPSPAGVAEVRECVLAAARLPAP